MKKTNRALTLRSETLRPLTRDLLGAVGGGFIMKDSVIVRTSTRVIEGPEPEVGERLP